MKLWQRVSGAFKDRNSLWLASIGRRHQFRNPALDAALIKATSHDHRSIDYTNTQRVLAWIRTSPASLLPFLVSLSRRLTRTRSPTVAIKGLILFHGLLSSNLPSTRKIGRLPFDLYSFDNAFVVSYFTFLDRKSVNLAVEFQDSEVDSNSNHTIAKRLGKIDRWQELLDLILKIEPGGRGKEDPVMYEAMECVIIEVFDVYSKICDGIANVMIRIYAAEEVEVGAEKAEEALDILRRATRQADELSGFFELCRGMGLLSESECPMVEKVSEDDVNELKRIIGGVEDEEETILKECKMRTVITDEWEVFEEEEKNMNMSLEMKISDKWEVFEEEMKVGDLIDFSEDYSTAIVPVVHTGIHFNYDCKFNFSEQRKIYV